ncbi:MAG: NAD(P)H-hydrate dehydratase [Crocinitomicaceae bacterium]|nr:NAD(P)H-hydrate dehydratase [Crocinitomicaceae bacterium]
MNNKILNTSQIKQADQHAVDKLGISSIDLMEKAATQFVNAIIPFIHGKPKIHIFCGTGNNGGDGFAVARLLKDKNLAVSVYYLAGDGEPSADCVLNQKRFADFKILEQESDFPVLQPDDVVIDALLGAGLNRPVEGILKSLILHINQAQATVLSIDMPSGLACDEWFENATCIQADFTGTFERPKRTFFLKETADFVGNWEVIPIGLNSDFMDSLESKDFYLTEDFFKNYVVPRSRFSHKGTYGHAMLIAGSKGKMGAAVLSSKAAMRSGLGLLTVHIPSLGMDILQTAVPEAMCEPDYQTDFSTKIESDLSIFSAIGAGPGMGNNEGTKTVLEQLFDSKAKLVLDADALNVLANHAELLKKLPINTILTPHPKEFERLCGKSINTFERLTLQRKFAQENRCILVLKDAITSIAMPNGDVFFNTTGNPGMATAGSGDVLTGITTGLLAQGYEPESAALLAVFFHGKAGDQAALVLGENQIIASDIIQHVRIEIK